MPIVDNVMDLAVKYINDVDREAVARTVATLREKHPDATTEELIESLIRLKCLQTGAMGAVTACIAIIPGLGSFAAMTFGVAADISFTLKLQAELVLEIAAANGHELSHEEKRTTVLSVTGLSAGGNQLLGMAGEKIARQASQELAKKSITNAIPILSVAMSAGVNIVTTYILGRRAQAYFARGPEELGEWSDNVRALVGVDERKLVDWLSETTYNSWLLINAGLQQASSAIVVSSRNTGKVILLGSQKTLKAVWGAGRSVMPYGKTETQPKAGNNATIPGDATANKPPTETNSGATAAIETPALKNQENGSGYLNRVLSLFSWGTSSAEAKSQLAAMDSATLANRIEKQSVAVIGVIGADDIVLEETSADKGFVTRMLAVLPWPTGSSSNTTVPLNQSDIVAADEDITVIVDEGSNVEADEAKPTTIARIFKVFRRGSESLDGVEGE